MWDFDVDTESGGGFSPAIFVKGKIMTRLHAWAVFFARTLLAVFAAIFWLALWAAIIFVGAIAIFVEPRHRGHGR